MPVKLRKMTREEFDGFYQWSIENSVKLNMERSGMSRKDAVEATEKEISEMLPDGMYTDNNHFMMIEEADGGDDVGYIWTLHEETDGKRQSFLCDFVIFEEKRRMGFATEALDAMEKQAIGADCEESVLFVEAYNHAAEALYEKCGYESFRHSDDGKYMKKQLRHCA